MTVPASSWMTRRTWATGALTGTQSNSAASMSAVPMVSCCFAAPILRRGIVSRTDMTGRCENSFGAFIQIDAPIQVDIDHRVGDVVLAVNALHIAIGGRRFAVGGAERRGFFPACAR